MTTDKPRPRGRPRRFDPEQAIATAQRLFHARGYDAVSVADLTEALGINPPSFYAAFGSKAGLYACTLGRYTAAEGVPLAEILRPGRPVAEALAEVLEDSARRYAADPAAAGCLAIEGARCNDPEARQAARALAAAAEDTIRRFVAATHPEAAGRLTDYVVTVMTGLSGMARQGYGQDRLLATARLAGLALAQVLRA
ncbi:TetR/AcrR family transcriptional regulator [Siccirubricoccus sp. KC 17139]|uniref:TetR/AcrR family transcriptional regulator n=1 Tax=Siccirubricoccus soli TaxID=2899147 RepID=A0ABT1D7Q6_9PROT|nr:TetR/AcrR family transcriptional regulator [Siccirubricoccus soli]MCO6417969.1 TetR/AcrR family transcriptional regulator [Siccirubricoccus soli]MCP2684104.1 TetR/AcrR family transcriptional regulator [Siccirubricoccus soli]